MSAGGDDTSVTLKEILAVAEAKKAPLAPELAGYLTLEIADQARADDGAIAPARVLVGAEGSVALIRPRDATPEGEVEQSLRALLARLLDASGSHTPALLATASRTVSTGLAALVEELEAALIPVNRAAGRRALARLAREVWRVRAGIGRNASTPPRDAGPLAAPSVAPRGPARAGARGSDSGAAARVESAEAPTRPRATTPLPSSRFDDEAVTARRPNQLPLAPAEALLAERAPLPAPAPLPAAPPSPEPAHEGPAGTSPVLSGIATRLFGSSDVDSLLGSFEVSESAEGSLRRGLKEIAGVDPTPGAPEVSSLAAAPAPAEPRPAPSARGTSDVDELLALADDGPPPEVVESSALAMPQAAPPARKATPVEPAASEPVALPGAPAALRASALASDTPDDARPRPPSYPASGEHRRPAAPRTSMAMGVLALVALACGVAAVWKLAPGFFTGRTPQRVAAERAAHNAAIEERAAAAAKARCSVSLLVQGAPTGAEILLLVGKAPTDIERMPVGTRLEFVATAEGFAPRRAVIAASSPWEKGGDGKPRYELAIQLDPAPTRAAAAPPWPAAEPGSEVGGSGQAGTVHVVSSPKGADVWLLAGLGPEAKIEQLRCDSDLELFVAQGAQLRKRLKLENAALSAVKPDDRGVRSVTVDAKGR